MFLVFLGVNDASAQANCSPTCNDLVQTSFDVWCNVPLTYDMFLEDGDNPRTCTPNGPQAFVIQAEDHTGKLVASSDDPDDNSLTCEDLSANLYQPFLIKVKHWATGNSCWSTLVLEDKLDPTLEVQDVELWCNEPFDPDYIEWTQGAGVGYPRGFDNCDELRQPINGSIRVDENRHGRDCNDLELTIVSDEITDIDCHPEGDISARIVRTWMLCDRFDNCITREQVITMRRLSIGQLNFPPDYDDWDRPALLPNKANGCQVNTMPGLVYDGQAHEGFPGRFGNGGTTQEPTGAPMIHGIPVSRIGDKDGYSYPRDAFGFCEINVTWEDLVIEVCVGSYKIIRTWTVVDWCTGEIVREDQIIKILDTETVIDAGDDLVISTNNNAKACEANFVPTPAQIWESCGQVRLATISVVGLRQRTHPHPVWSTEEFTLVDNAQGVISGSGTGDPVIVTFDPILLSGPVCGDDLSVPATYTVTYRTTDDCGNTSEDSYQVEVVDKTPPTPFCRDLFTAVMPGSGLLDLWASDLDAGSFDNCDGCSDGLTFSFSPDPTDNGLTLTCADASTKTLSMYVHDNAGNSSFCTTTVSLQVNPGSCAGTAQSPFTQSAISGTIANESGELLDEVTVQTADKSVITGVNGAYIFQLDQGKDYTISAERDMDPLNGVSTFDLVLLRKHIVGTQELTSPYDLIAADINKSGDITAFDMVQLRQVVLQLVPNFPSNTSWRFIDKNHQFTTANALGENFNEVYDITNLSADMSIDFIAVKIGDLNGNAIPNSLVGAESRNAAGTFAFNMEDQFVQVGEKVNVEFTSADMPTTQGFQFTLNFEGLEFDELVEGAATAANFNTVQAKRGTISTSWDGQATEKEVAFGVTFTATTSGQLSELLSISSDQVVAEAYNNEGELLNVALNFNAVNTATTFELFQNTPNPFDGATVIGFNLPQAGNATLKVLDIQGKILRSVTGDYNKGLNQISLNAKDLNATGVLYYQLESAEHVATKKMIIID